MEPLVFLMMPVAAVLLRELTVALNPNKSSAPIFTTRGFGPATGPSAVALPSCSAVFVPLPTTVMPPVKLELFPLRMTVPVEVEVMVSGALPVTGALTVSVLAELLAQFCVLPRTKPLVLMVTLFVPEFIVRLLFSVRMFVPPIVISVPVGAVLLKIN